MGVPARGPPHHTEMTSSSLRASGSLPSSTQKKPDVLLAPAVRTSSSEWLRALGRQGSGLLLPPRPTPPGRPRDCPVPKEAHLLAAQACHPGVGARGAQQPPRALRVVEHHESGVGGADLHCRATGRQPGSPPHLAPPRTQPSPTELLVRVPTGADRSLGLTWRAGTLGPACHLLLTTMAAHAPHIWPFART